MRLVLALILLQVIFLSGCETTQQRIDRNFSYFRTIPASHQELVRQGRIGIGFTRMEVYLAWGSPDHEAFTETAAGTQETWIYTRRFSETHYRRVRVYDERRQRWEYEEQPVSHWREYVTMDVVFINDRVSAWTAYQDPMPYGSFPRSHY